MRRSEIGRFHNIHAGQTALLVGNGPNLGLTPPEWFNYPAFGTNSICMYEGWKPTYYAAVDVRAMNEFGGMVAEKYSDIPKFIPSPNLDKWTGENFYRFNYCLPGPLWRKERGRIWNPDRLEENLIFANVMHVAMQMAFYMGFTTLLIIGMQHKPGYAPYHFWGHDPYMGITTHLQNWIDGYEQLTRDMAALGVKVINISEDTYVSDKIIPRGNWREWRNN